MNKIIVLRINYFKDYDFIAEHNKILDAQQSVWLLKIGRKIPEGRMRELLENQGTLVLKADKKHGGIYYETKVFDYYYGEPKKTMNHPNYYQQLIDTLAYTRDVSVDGTWIKIGIIHKMNENRVRRMILEKTGEPIYELMNKCSTAYMYANLIDEEEIIHAEDAI